MTPADRLALLAHLDALAAEATAGEWHSTFLWFWQAEGPVQFSHNAETPADAAFIVALVNGYPALAAAIRDGEARSARVADDLRQAWNEAEAERDAATARADAAERRVDWLLTRGARLAAILNLCAPCGPRPDIGRLHDEQKGALDAWQEMAP